ncbi:MAG: class I SAM-dependent methyltransferase [Phycisphaerae bacterium]
MMRPDVGIAVETDSPELHAKAEALRASLHLPAATVDDTSYPLLLVVTPRRLELRETGKGRVGPVYADFVGGRVGYRVRTASAGRAMLAKAVGFKGGPLSVCDATAGLGRDAFLLACMGCAVTAVERSPVIAALLQDGLDRAAVHPKLAHIVRERLRPVVADAREFLPRLAGRDRPDVVYIDPMFPQAGRTALAAKDMQLCRKVAGDDPDAAELLAAARPIARLRVVVKRSLRAPALAADPSIVYRGTTIRYDVYLPTRIPSSG